MSEYEYAVSDRLRDAVAALDSRDGLGFTTVMALDADGPFRFGELRTAVDVHQGTLSAALSELQSSGLVRKRPGERIGDRQTGAYELTPFGEHLLDGFEYAHAPERFELRRVDAADGTDESNDQTRAAPAAGTASAATDEQVRASFDVGDRETNSFDGEKTTALRDVPESDRDDETDDERAETAEVDDERAETAEADATAEPGTRRS